MYEIDQLLLTGRTTKGYRQSCVCTDSTVKSFAEFESKIKKLNLVIIKNVVKTGNAYASNNGGFWNEFTYSVVKDDLITPNVNLIIKEKYRIIKGKIPRSVRNELNTAVKHGILGRVKKDGLCPECYYFVNFESEARNAIYSIAEDSINAIAKISINEAI